MGHCKINKDVTCTLLLLDLDVYKNKLFQLVHEQQKKKKKKKSQD